MERVMEVEGEEEGSDTFKALKIGCFTISVSSSFLYSSGVFSGEKKGKGQVFLYIGRVREGEGKEEGVYALEDALLALYRR